MSFLISAVRAVVELIGLCLLGQGALYFMTGGACGRNPIYRLFAIVTAPPRRLVRLALPFLATDRVVSVLTFFLLLFLWIGLAWMRKLV